MTSVEILKRDRASNRFVAFSFAAADLLLEVGPTNAILYVSGSARAVSGHDGEDLIGKPYDLLFAEPDRQAIRRQLAELEQGGRLEPMTVTLAEAFGGVRTMVLGGCRLPGAVSQYYLTISSPQGSEAQEAGDRDPTTGLLDEGSFQNSAAEVLRRSSDGGRELGLTLLRLTGYQAFSLQAGPAATDRFVSGIGALLRACSLDGRTAGGLGNDCYGVVHGAGFDISLVEARVASLARSAAPQATAPGCERSGVELTRGSLSPDEAAMALGFCISSFAATSGGFAIDSLAAAFEKLLAGTIVKFKAYKDIVSESRFSLAFQPIVDLADGSVRHFEVLSRFEGDRSPHEMVSFAEEIGVIEQFDLLVCKRAVEYLLGDARDAGTKLAVNLSARSLNSRLFIDSLLGLLDGAGLQDRLLFEITESTQIADLAGANAAIGRLRQQGFRVGLDDFTADASSFAYLQALTVDFVKIDGAYLRAALNEHRSAMILKAMCGLCRDIGAYAVAKMVESREQLEQLRALGVDCGQGYFFGKPAAQAAAPEVPMPGIGLHLGRVANG